MCLSYPSPRQRVKFVSVGKRKIQRGGGGENGINEIRDSPRGTIGSTPALGGKRPATIGKRVSALPPKRNNLADGEKFLVGQRTKKGKKDTTASPVSKTASFRLETKSVITIE